MCLLSSAQCTTAGVRVMGLMITAQRQTDATHSPLCEIWSKEVHMGAIVGLYVSGSVIKAERNLLIGYT